MNQSPRIVAAVVTTIAALLLLLPLGRGEPKTEYDFASFKRIIVSADGRIKPIDTVARNGLLVISGRQSLKHEGDPIAPEKWLLDIIARPQLGERYAVFRIDHPDIKTLLSLDADKKRYTFAELFEQREVLLPQLQAASAIDKPDRDAYQAELVELGRHVQLYNQLVNLARPYVVLPASEEDEPWRPLLDVTAATQRGEPLPPSAQHWLKILEAYHNKDAAEFNTQVRRYMLLLEQRMPDDVDKAAGEVVFNRYQPFYVGMVMYIVVFLVALAGFVCYCLEKQSLFRTFMLTAVSLLTLTFVLHSVGIGVRIALQGRPPVTNLYSSAVFIGWGSVLLCLVIESFFRYGVGSLVASVIGFSTLLIAHHLGKDGDTMEMMQAVLDSNFWLATHVIAVTLGYVATFVAGFVGLLYILLGVFTKVLDDEQLKRALGRIMYGVVCFALLFSFVGTVLGGIWADQSWGRFWGWDPKENGAVLIVLMNALILHARWGGMVRNRGIAVLAVGGNIVTGWSWFGTNMLGVGLHSYGFMDKALIAMFAFVASQLVIMAIGMLPADIWRSGMDGAPRADATRTDAE